MNSLEIDYENSLVPGHFALACCQRHHNSYTGVNVGAKDIQEGLGGFL